MMLKDKDTPAKHSNRQISPKRLRPENITEELWGKRLSIETKTTDRGSATAPARAAVAVDVLVVGGLGAGLGAAEGASSTPIHADQRGGRKQTAYRRAPLKKRNDRTSNP